MVQTTRYLGDITLTLPLIWLLGDPPVVCHPKFKDYLDFLGIRCIPYDKDRGGLGEFLRVAGVMRGARGAILAHESVRSGLLALAAGARERVGFADAQASLLYTHRVRKRPKEHWFTRFQRLAGPLGLEPREGLSYPRDAVERALSSVSGLVPGEPYVGLSPGTTRRVKAWPLSHWEELASLLRDEGVLTVAVGAPGTPRIRGVDLDLVGRTGIPELLGILAGARALLAPDSGPVHMASLLGTPTVAIFGPTTRDMGVWPLRGRVVELPLGCRPCRARGDEPCPLGHHRCLRDITPEMVLRAYREILR